MNERERRERQESWIQTLKDVAERRRQEAAAARKRELADADEEQTTIERSPKMPRVSEESDLSPSNQSLARFSVKSLPSLPIIEQTEEILSSSVSGAKPPKPVKSQVDKDELLLSSARIAAESLRTGPKIFDGVLPEVEALCSSISSPHPRMFSSSRFSSSQRLTRSESPSVSYNSENDLGLGRSLSRTEQRIKLTGGKGLAYKTPDFKSSKRHKAGESLWE